MTATFHARLVNGPCGDPALHLQCLHERRALLFDAGDLAPLAPADILKITDVFVTHTHIDHFVGFDRILRVVLNRDKELRFWGPEGLVANVAGKLAGYTWNLVEDYRLRLVVHEVSPAGVRRVTFSCRDRFRRRTRATVRPFGGPILDDGRFRVRAALLDHAVPCLGYRLEEAVRHNVDKAALERRGWSPGPWLNRVKEALRAGRPGDTPVRVPAAGGGRGWAAAPLAEVARDIVIETPGVRLAYVTDAAPTESNARRIVELARGVDQFYCEAAFMERDAEHAARKAHLTARRAGEIAREAGVGRLTVFHFSPKYLGEEDAVREEARAAFEGPVMRGA